jgi:hypothetical protein
MQPAGQVVVSLPPTDRPALEDPPTRLAVDNLTSGYGGLVGLVMIPVLILLAHLAPRGFRIDELAVLLFGCLVPLSVVAVVMRLWIGHYDKKLRRLLADTPWRPVPAQLLRGGLKSTSCVVRLDDGPAPVLMRISRARWSVQQVIGRTGRLWTAGPGTDGTTVVTVDGWRGGFFANVVDELSPGAEPVVATFSRTGTPLEDPVTASAAARPNGFVGRLLVVALVMWPFFTAVAAFAGRSSAAPVVGVLGAGVYLFGWELRLLWRWRRLRSLLRSGPWTPLPARLGQWPDQRRLHANVAGEVSLPDGTVAAVTLLRANMDVFVNAVDSGVLWVAGEPARGRTFAVGVPGYPVLGMAMLR